MATIPASENVFPLIRLAEVAAPATPPTGELHLYAKAGGLLYWKDDAGNEYDVGAAAAHVADASGAHAASAIAFTPAGTIAATDVQAAIEEVASEAGGSPAASAVSIADAGGYFTGTDVEAALQELGAAGGGGLTHAYLGYNTAGGSTEGMVQYRSYFKKITPGASGLLVSVGAYLANAAANVESFAVAVLTDATNAPGNVIAMNMVASSAGNALFASTSARWVDIPITAYLTGSTSYWLGISVQNSGTRYNLAYDGSGSDQYHTAGGFYISDGAKYALTVSSNKYSIRAGYLT